MTDIPRNESPEGPGLYYFQPAPGEPHYRSGAYYVAAVFESYDPVWGIRVEVDYSRWVSPRAETPATKILFGVPLTREAKYVSEMKGTWWGPLPDPDL